MKSKTFIYFLVYHLCSCSMNTNAQIQIGLGSSVIVQEMYYLTPELNEFATNGFHFEKINQGKSTHFVANKKWHLSKNKFLSLAAEMDATVLSIRTKKVPDNNFANSKFYYNQQQLILDIPLGWCIRIMSSKKPLLFNIGSSLGAYINLKPKILYDIYTPNDQFSISNSSKNEKKIQLNTSLWLKCQYQLFKYNCLSSKGLWIEGQIKQFLFFNSVQTLNATFITPTKTFDYNYKYQNRPFLIAFSCLFDL